MEALTAPEWAAFLLICGLTWDFSTFRNSALNIPIANAYDVVCLTLRSSPKGVRHYPQRSQLLPVTQCVAQRWAASWRHRKVHQ